MTCGIRSVRIRSKNNAKVRDWVAAINDAGLRPPEGWCHPHRFGSFAPPRGLTEDGSQAQWFIDGKAAFNAVASAIEDAKFEVCTCQSCAWAFLDITLYMNGSQSICS